MYAADYSAAWATPRLPARRGVRTSAARRSRAWCGGSIVELSANSRDTLLLLAADGDEGALSCRVQPLGLSNESTRPIDMIDEPRTYFSAGPRHYSPKELSNCPKQIAARMLICSARRWSCARLRGAS